MNFAEMSDADLAKELELINLRNEKYGPFKEYWGKDRVLTIQHLQNILEKRPKNLKLSCKIPALDNTLDGFEAGELVVISGPTGEGKTTLAQSLSVGFSDKGTPLFLSYEVTLSGLVERFKNSGNLPPLVVPLSMEKEDTNLSELQWLEERIMEAIAKFKTKVVFIDHLHYLARMKNLSEEKNISFAIGAVMRDLKRIALEHEITIFVIAHTKKSEMGAEMTLYDIRDSSFIAQEADIILLIWREVEENMDDMKEYTENAYIRIAKNRRLGKTGVAKMLFSNGVFLEKQERPVIV